MNKTIKQQLQLIILSLVLHLLIIVLLFALSSYDTLHKKFVVLGAHSQKPTHALYRPMHGFVPFKQPTTHVPTIKPKKETVTKKQAVPKKQTVAKKTPTVAKAVKKAEQPAKHLPEVSANKPKQKQQKTTPKQAPAKQPQPSIIPKEPEKKVVNPIKEAAPKEKEQVVEQPTEELTEQLDFTHEAIDGSYDPRMHEYQLAIQEEVARRWHPPVGVEKGTEAICSFTINRNGTVDSFDFIRKSGIVIYDMSIKLVAKKLMFNKKLWGKSFTIAFRQ